MAGRLTGVMSAVVIALGAVTSSAVAAATSTDESQIRQVVAAELTALRALDPTAYAQNFCAEYRDAYEAWVQRNITPPPFEDLEGANPKRLTSVLRKNFPTVSDTAIQAFVDAATEGDREAYHQAWRGILREEFSHYSYRVRQVHVTGDQAEVTVQATLGKASGTVPWQFLRESGDWTDCTAPPVTPDSASPSLKGEASQGLLGEIGDVRAAG
ncbi:hypothetical protein ONA92_17600 [Mycobacteroides salmoniphilum]|uniref:hypothetical protein n=1 Tax=Mycobacteroides salmoniphilum TaxID=404941 RepID=UPI0035683199